MAEAEFVLSVVRMVTLSTMDDDRALPQKRRNEAISYNVKNSQVEEFQSIIPKKINKKNNALG